MPCNCASYNSNTSGVPEVVLDPRPYFAFTTKTVCVDACIADQIRALWGAGVWTRGCCCGHGLRAPEVFIDSATDAEKASSVLASERRAWRVMFWVGSSYQEGR